MFVEWMMENGYRLADLGMLATMLTESDPRPAAEQFNERYNHGGDWQPTTTRRWKLNLEKQSLTYPGDPPLYPIAWGVLRDERIYVFQHSWVCIVQENGNFEVARMD